MKLIAIDVQKLYFIACKVIDLLFFIYAYISVLKQAEILTLGFIRENSTLFGHIFTFNFQSG